MPENLSVTWLSNKGSLVADDGGGDTQFLRKTIAWLVHAPGSQGNLRPAGNSTLYCFFGTGDDGTLLVDYGSIQVNSDKPVFQI